MTGCMIGSSGSPPRTRPPLANVAEKPTAVKECGEVPRKDGRRARFLGKLAVLDTDEEGGGPLLSLEHNVLSVKHRRMKTGT